MSRSFLAHLNSFPFLFAPDDDAIDALVLTPSKAMQESWRLMSTIAARHDSQLALEDAQVPGGKYLGAALADHLAVALPFDESTDKAVKSMADQGRYPRAALLEALVRFVTQDLDGK